MVFVNEKDLRHHETISIKASLFKGIAVRLKDLNQFLMESLLYSIQFSKDNGITNLMFDDCKLNKKSVQKLIEFIKTTNIIEGLCLHKVTFEESTDFKKLVEAI